MQNSKRATYDLEERLKTFSKNVRVIIKSLPKKLETIDDMKQLVRSSGSITANYIEANESLSKKDFLMRIKISKKEARETEFWIEMIRSDNSAFEKQLKVLQKEVHEIILILGAIYRNSK